MDKLTPARRSENMRKIRSGGTSPEQAVMAVLRSLRFKPEINRRDLPGKPDFVFARRRKVIFVHGCFWHQHRKQTCLDGRLPKSRRGYWLPKLAGNVRRDKRSRAKLRRSGWGVLTIWDCETRDVEKLRIRVARFLRSNLP